MCQNNYKMDVGPAACYSYPNPRLFSLHPIFFYLHSQPDLYSCRKPSLYTNANSKGLTFNSFTLQLNCLRMEKQVRPLLSIAPMIDISNTHFRYFTRLLTKQATIYTEMLHHNALIYNHRTVLPFHHSEHPIVLQLGGSDPHRLADAAQIGVQYGYDEINLNVGCPSPKVQEGSFGACLMKEPQLVYECMKAVRERVKGTACTVKCRLGVDEFDSYEFARDFIKETSREGNVEHYIIHARKAFLKGLNPAQNRNVPPLWYDRVYQLQQDFPNIKFSLNGGVKTLKHAQELISQHKLWGVMVGRMAYEDPYELVMTDQLIYGCPQAPIPTREQILLQYADYLDNVQSGGYFNPVDSEQEAETAPRHGPVNPATLIKPVIHLYHGEKNNAKYRQYLSDPKRLKSGALSDVIKGAVELMRVRGEEERVRDIGEEK